MIEAIESMIQAKGKTAPRVTPADIEANIKGETYFTAAQGWNGEAASDERTAGLLYPADGPLNLLTFCVLVLRNGFTVTGESACASPENFDAEIGRKIARANAIAKIWPLMGYELKCHLASTPPAPAKPKTYTWDDVATHEVARMSMTNEIEYHINMRDGAAFTGNVKPNNYTQWQSLALSDINRQAAA